MTDYITYSHFISPCGGLMLAAVGDKICMCDWLDSPRHAAHRLHLSRALGREFIHAPSPVTDEAAEQLLDYFEGRRRGFDIPLLFTGTPFQLAVWRGLSEVDYGHTLSYSALAQKIGCPRAVRAVAAAVATNPFSIIIPCHRIIGSRGSLTGYAGGLEAKQALLAWEHFFQHDF